MNQPAGGPPPHRTNKNVWTWILIGVIATCGACGVVGIAIVFPILGQKSRVARFSRTHLVTVATSLYLGDYDDMYPVFSSAPEAANKYAKYIKDPAATADAATYDWNYDFSGISATSVPDAAQVWIFYDPKRDVSGKFAMGFADTHVKRYILSDLRDIKSKSTEMMAPVKKAAK